MQDATSPQGTPASTFRHHVCAECGLAWKEQPDPDATATAALAGSSWADVCPRCQVWAPPDATSLAGK